MREDLQGQLTIDEVATLLDRGGHGLLQLLKNNESYARNNLTDAYWAGFRSAWELLVQRKPPAPTPTPGEDGQP